MVYWWFVIGLSLWMVYQWFINGLYQWLIDGLSIWFINGLWQWFVRLSLLNFMNYQWGYTNYHDGHCYHHSWTINGHCLSMFIIILRWPFAGMPHFSHVEITQIHQYIMNYDMVQHIWQTAHGQITCISYNHGIHQIERQPSGNLGFRNVLSTGVWPWRTLRLPQNWVNSTWCIRRKQFTLWWTNIAIENCHL